MAAKPIERHVKRQIAEQGGWPRILPAKVGKESVAATPKAKRSDLMSQIKSHLTPKGKLRRGD